MKPQLSPDEAHLNDLWRETFGQPMPLIGAPDIARRILRQHGVSPDDLNRQTSGPMPPRASGRRDTANQK